MVIRHLASILSGAQIKSNKDFGQFMPIFEKADMMLRGDVCIIRVLIFRMPVTACRYVAQEPS